MIATEDMVSKKRERGRLHVEFNEYCVFFGFINNVIA